MRANHFLVQFILLHIPEKGFAATLRPSENLEVSWLPTLTMILSRIKPAIKKPSTDDGAGGAEAGAGGQAAASTSSAGLQTKAMPKLEEFLEKRDYTGAMTLLEFNRSSGKGGDLVDMWLGYCAFHVGDYKRAMLEYEALTHAKKPPKDAYLNLACIFFYLGEFRSRSMVVA